MSVIVENKEGQILIFQKGADSEILKRINLNINEKYLSSINKDIYSFSTTGYRTLCMSVGIVESAWFDNWYSEYLELRNNAGRPYDSQKSQI